MQATTLPDGPIAEKTPADPHHAVWALLESVKDPEIPVVSLREMGILRAVRDVGAGGLEVVITPTYSGCPAMSQMHDDVASALSDAGIPARVVLQHVVTQPSALDPRIPRQHAETRMGECKPRGREEDASLWSVVDLTWKQKRDKLIEDWRNMSPV